MAPVLVPAPLPNDGFQWQQATQSGLVLDCTIHPDSPVVERFFASYDKAFVLPREREELEGFKACLALCSGAPFEDLVARYGPFREVIAVALDEGVMVGGANFIVFPLDLTDEGGRSLLSANLNYLFVASEARGKGYFRRLVRAVRELMLSLFPSETGQTPRLLTFIEQNDPLRMDPDDYRLDTEFTGLDQLERLRIWAKLDARVVDHPYVQPALSEEQEPDDTLVLSVLGSNGVGLEACALEAHLRRFFGISVRKGEPLDTDATAAMQLAALRAACSAGAEIALIDPMPLAGAVSTPEAARALVGDSRPELTFLEALKRV
jgi:GNAT superfamily N-acetyltransferase